MQKRYPTLPLATGFVLLLIAGLCLPVRAANQVGLVLTDSQSQPLADQRVDLLRANGSDTGVRAYTDENGVVPL